jgi:hypothetical protein
MQGHSCSVESQNPVPATMARDTTVVDGAFVNVLLSMSNRTRHILFISFHFMRCAVWSQDTRPTSMKPIGYSWRCLPCRK